ncbi:hypothetical protein [Paenibacillus aceti]|uniref:hypothetical protein n=1 Tax=Paenibacillus aceti TaxID=1820010 RepID=UPI000EA29977|nr:hypothetical protein [Paenibacillus aceti]
MKKIVGIVMSFIFIFSFGNVSFANSLSELDSKVLYNAQEITDIDLLYERAKHGISDVVSKNPDQNIAFVSDAPINGTIKEYTTTQKLLAVEKNGVLEESFKTVSFLVYTEEKSTDEEKPGLIQPRGSKEEEDWDSSKGVRAYSTVKYTRSTNNNLYTYKLDSVSGGWNSYDHGTLIIERKVKYGITGNAQGSGIAVSKSSGDLYPNQNTFDYTAPSSWPALESNVVMGVNTYITLKRQSGTYEWTLHLQNNLTN